VTALALKGVSKRFGDLEVLRSIDLAVPKGTLFALLGASGSGKTTLLRCVAGFERVDDGSIEIAGAPVDDGGCFVPPERRSVGYVSQDGSLFPHLSVERNVLFGLPRRQRTSARAEELLASVDLEGFGTRRPTELSGGQRQRVALARALARDPALILLDEPFAALDAALRSEVRDQVAAVLREHGATTVLVTHDQDEALSMADRVAVLRDGSIVQEAAPDMLYRRPVDVSVAEFIGEANVLPGTKRGSEVATGIGPVAIVSPETVADGPVDVVLRPEQLELAAPTAERSFSVIRHRYHGHEAMTHVAGPGGVELVIRHDPRLRAVPGDQVAVAVTGKGVAFPRPERNTAS
jgi:iron(III) transport system ATP-binding protein